MGQGPPTNRTYRNALAIALVLFFVTLTGAIILMIITSARDDKREDDFNATVTAVVSSAQQTLAAQATPPTPAPAILSGEYTFAPDLPVPRYSPSDLPTRQIVRGQVLNEDGEPEDRFSVMVWGDYTPQQTLATGEIAELAPGHWAVSLEGQVNRRLWVQVVAGDRYLSAPVEIVFEEANAERSAAEVIFRQVRPLN